MFFFIFHKRLYLLFSLIPSPTSAPRYRKEENEGKRGEFKVGKGGGCCSEWAAPIPPTFLGLTFPCCSFYRPLITGELAIGAPTRFLCHNNLTFIGRVTVIVSIVVFIFLLLLRVRGNPLAGLEHVGNIHRIKMIAFE